jgi:hypothetical protein
LLKNDYDLDLTETQLNEFTRLLRDEIAPELRSFLEDATFDVVAGNLDLDVDEALRKLVTPEHAEMPGATIRSEVLKRRQRRPINRLSEASRGKDIFKYRAVTPAGRLTPKAASVAVRRHEVLLLEGEVMMAVAYTLAAAGYTLLGISDEEFLLELPAARGDRSRTGVDTPARRQRNSSTLGRCGPHDRGDYRAFLVSLVVMMCRDTFALVFWRAPA